MTDYQVEVRVTPREGLLDPQGKAITGALHSLGFDGVASARVGRLIRLSVSAASEAEAHARVDEMCRKLLANPVTEDYAIEAFGSGSGSGSGSGTGSGTGSGSGV